MWQLHPDATELGFVFSYILSRPENCNRDPNVERVNGFHFSSGLSLGTLGRRAKPADRAEILNSIEFFLSLYFWITNPTKKQEQNVLERSFCLYLNFLASEFPVGKINPIVL